jgi:hypothetical protein
MSLYDRLGLNFDTTRFGDAQTLSSGASNTLGLIANTSGVLPTWQQDDLSVGSPVRTNYFQNPTTTYLNTMLTATNSLFTSSNSANDFVTSAAASSLIIEINNFQSHTDNISGVSAVSNTYFPSLQSAGNMGQLNMMTLSKSDGVSNTAPILGSFTSLFINDMLSSNANTLVVYASQYAGSLGLDGGGNTTSNLSNSQITTINNYLANTQSLLSTRRTGDVTFYQNSTQLAQDVGFMQQFSNMGGTMSYLVNNFVGTTRLLANLSSSSS